MEFTLLALEKCALPNEVVVTRDGKEALDYLLMRNDFINRTPGNPALLLLDPKMPKLDGVEVFKVVRSTPHLASLPVIILTQSSVDTDIHRTRILGISQYIIKPLTQHEFITEVHQAVRQLV